MIRFAIISTKGGVGKTTLAANLGALLADLGLRVLLIDADVQPTLSKYYAIKWRAPRGLTQVITGGVLVPEAISQVALPGLEGVLDIVLSDSPEGEIQNWLVNQSFRERKLWKPLHAPAIEERYDCVLMDTQGAVGPLQDAAALAADILVTPVAPDILSAREYLTGTLDMFARLSDGDMKLAPVKALIYRQDRTADAKAIARVIREDHVKMSGRVEVLNTVVPAAKAYKEAATAQIPVHWHDARRSGASPCASEILHAVAWELVPSLEGVLATGEHRAATATVAQLVEG